MGSSVRSTKMSGGRYSAGGRARPGRRNGRAQAVTSSAYLRLRDLIVNGSLAPGMPLIETHLSERLGVSRTPIRAALQRLEQEGFVGALTSGRALRAAVAPLTAGDMREVFLMVGALEGAAARLAAGLEASQRQPLAASMQQLHDGVRQAVSARPPDIVAAHDLHVSFHRAYVHAAGGDRLRAELEVLQPQAERYSRVYAAAMVYGFADAMAEHDGIARAIADGDADAAELLVGRNWRADADRYEQVVTILGERGNW
jgi:DNA-binding GntR family transcriptional regulator